MVPRMEPRPSRYRIEHRRPDGTVRTLVEMSELREVNAMLSPLLVQFADGHEAGTMLVIDQHADPESAVVGCHDIGA
jgi:hypothetical protein